MRIGILSMQHVRNYGSFLQAYALKTTLESFGHQCEFVDIEQGNPLPGLERNLKYLVGMAFKRYFNWNAIVSSLGRMKYQKLYYERFDKEYLPELGIHKHTFNEYDLVVIGSDEVFNFNQHTTYGFTTQLYGDVKNAKKVLSYAGSFGTTTIDVVDKFGVRDVIAKAMGRMAAISVRDDNSLNVVKNLLGKEPSYNIDPVLMFDYQKYAKEPKEKDYIVVYSYPNRIKGKDEINAIRSFAKIKGKKLISICFYFPWCDETVIPHPFEVLGYMKNADYIITDTFHGCVMSIKFNKKFAALVRESNMQKMNSLLDQFGLSERACHDITQIGAIVDRDIDYNPVNDLLKKEHIKSIDYLKSNL
jgi:polysaccharide pyruvyl transferase WcaK-like protein